MHEHGSVWEEIQEHLSFILIALAVIAAIALLATVLEKLIEKKTQKKLEKWTARKIACTGLFAAIGGVLMTIEIPLVFLVPSFYTLDLSEAAAMMAGFLLGPVAGVIVEFIKAILHIVLHGTHSAFVGEFASFVLGCAYVLPASYIYMVHKTKKGALVSLILGTVSLSVFGGAFNGFYLIPKFADLYGVSIDTIIEMGAAINSLIDSLWSFVALATVPFNILKGVVISAVVFLIYKPLGNLYRKLKK